jgi:formamidopyrimidine-DNA glycosylase
MPELPDITVYLDALEARILDAPLVGVRLKSPFLLRTVQPKPLDTVGRTVTGLRRIGKRIAIGFDNDIWFVFHLMIAGRLQWKPVGAKIGAKSDLPAFDFPAGTLTLTEAGSKKRAALHIVEGAAALNALDPGGIEALDCTLDIVRAALTAANHTVKRALTDPQIFSGICNAYSDEILHRARISPIVQTQKMPEEAIPGCTAQRRRRWRTGPKNYAAKRATGLPKK